ncbi:MAG: alpha/beta fold hydrolase, partial [Robiginitalea sp.]
GTVLLENYVSDVRTLVRYFEKDPRFTGIHLLGHSQGSLVGMLSLSGNSPVRSLVSIAGAASPIDSVLIRQLGAQSPDLAREVSDHLGRLRNGDTLGEVSPMLRPLFVPANLPILKEWMGYHPVEVFRKTGVPALLIYGEEDTQVPPEAGSRLKKARPEARFVLIPGMNHVLKQLETPSDNIRSYTDSSMPVNPQLIREIVEFISRVE